MACALLSGDFGVPRCHITWVRGGIDTPGRPGKIPLNLPPGGAALRNPDVGWLFDDPTAAAKDCFRRTGVFPIMHPVGSRRVLAEQHLWLPGAVMRAFTAAKALALEALSDTSATSVTLPFVEEQLRAARDALGGDFWAYGVERSRRTLETFVRHHHAKGLSAQPMSVDEILLAATCVSFSI